MIFVPSLITTLLIITMPGVMVSEEPAKVRQERAPPIGGKLFKGVLQTKGRPVDKSLLIADILAETNFRVILIARPRRFGKSTNLSMLKNFLSNGEKATKARLFSGLDIMDPKYNDLRAENMNTHPVIHFSFETVHGKTYAEAFKAMKLVMKEVYKSHLYLIDTTTVLSKANRKRFLNVICETSVSQRDLVFAINRMSKYLRDKYNKTSIILIDDYDAPLTSAYENGYLNDMIHLLKSFFHVTLKSNDFFSKAVVFGVTKVSLGDIGAANARPFTLFQPEFDRYFGFDESEVKNLISHFGLAPEILKNVTERYGGYVMGNTRLHVPESVVDCLTSNGQFRKSWTESVTLKPLKSMLKQHGLLPILTFQHLLYGLPVKKTIKMFSFMLPNLINQEEAFWAYMVYIGYLTINARPATTIVANVDLNLRIPNEEIRLLIKDTIDDLVKEGFVPDYDQFIQSLVKEDTGMAKKLITEYLEKSGKYFCDVEITNLLTATKFSNYVSDILKGLEKVYGTSLTIESKPEGVEVFIKSKDGVEKDFEFTIVQTSSKEEFDSKFSSVGFLNKFIQSTKKAIQSIYKKSDVRQIVIGYCANGCDKLQVSVDWIT